MLRLTALLFPLMILAMILKQERPVSVFIKAGAVTSDTARRPGSLEIEKLYLLENPIKHGVLVALGDGRFYVDVPQHKRRRRWMIALMLGVGVLTGGLAILFLPGCED